MQYTYDPQASALGQKAKQISDTYAETEDGYGSILHLQNGDDYVDSFIELSPPVKSFFGIGGTDYPSIYIGFARERRFQTGPWVSYVITIRDPERNAAISHIARWHEVKGETTVPREEYSEIVDHALRAVDNPPAPGNVRLEQQAPDSMY